MKDVPVLEDLLVEAETGATELLAPALLCVVTDEDAGGVTLEDDAVGAELEVAAADEVKEGGREELDVAGGELVAIVGELDTARGELDPAVGELEATGEELEAAEGEELEAAEGEELEAAEGEELEAAGDALLGGADGLVVVDVAVLDGGGGASLDVVLGTGATLLETSAFCAV